jgi:hypothetical protein
MTAWVVIPGDENMRPRQFATQGCLDKLLIVLGRIWIFVRTGRVWGIGDKKPGPGG